VLPPAVRVTEEGLTAILLRVAVDEDELELELVGDLQATASATSPRNMQIRINLFTESLLFFED
jgi:hypothetical protein